MWNNPTALNSLALALVLCACALFVLEAGVWVAHRPFFRLTAVRVEGDGAPLRHVTAATIRAGALPQIRGSLFTVDLNRVRAAFEGVAWVRHARVRRLWPNRLAVYLEEHDALGIWNDDRLVDQHGEVFAANLAEAESDGALPRFYGPDGSAPDVVAHYADFRARFGAVRLAPAEVTLSARYAWSVQLTHLADPDAEPIEVELGREAGPGGLVNRIGRFVAAYPAVTRQWPRLTQVDLRYPNGFALRAEGLKLAGEDKAKNTTPATARPVSPHHDARGAPHAGLRPAHRVAHA